MTTPAPRPTAAPRGRYVYRAWVVTVMAMLLMMINFGDKAVFGLAARQIIGEYHLTDAMFGLISSSTYLLFSLAAIVAGFVSVRVPTTRILLAITILWSVACVPLLLFGAARTLFFNRILLGAAEGPTAPMLAHTVYKWFPDDRRGLPTSLQHLGVSAGIVVFGPILDAVIHAFDWRTAFALMAVVGLAWALLWMVVGREGPFGTYASAHAGADVAAAEPVVSYRRLLLTHTGIGAVIQGWGCYWALAVSVAWLPLMLEERFAYSGAVVGGLIAAPPIVGALGVLVLPWLSERAIAAGASVRAARGIATGAISVVSGLAAFLVPLSHGAVAIGLMAVAFGLPTTAYPMMYLMMGQMSPVRRRGVLMSTVAGLVTLCGAIAPWLFGIIVGSTASKPAGYDAALVVTAAILTVTGLVGMGLYQPAADAGRLGLLRFSASTPGNRPP